MTLVKSFDIHITLKFFKELSEEKAALVHESLKTFHFSPFEACLGKVDFFPHVVFVTIEPEARFHLLHKLLQEHLCKAGFEKELDFSCHATLARIKKRIIFSEWIRTIDVPQVSFLVSEFFFIQSTLTHEGPIYKEIYRISSELT